MQISEITPPPASGYKFTREDLLRTLQEDFARILKVPTSELPSNVSPDEASKFLGVAKMTLSIWRSTGRYNLPYFKIGRFITYNPEILIQFKASRLQSHVDAA